MASREAGVKELFLTDDGVFPNSDLPVLIYPAIDLGSPRETVLANGWSDLWTNGIYDFPHYHSTAHELLLVLSGSAEVQLGGPSGKMLHLRPALGLILPAGVCHQRLSCSPDFQVMGAYPAGQSCDMNYGRPEERPGTDRAIANLSLPDGDPFFGRAGPLLTRWKRPT